MNNEDIQGLKNDMFHIEPHNPNMNLLVNTSVSPLNHENHQSFTSFTINSVFCTAPEYRAQ